MDFRAARQWWLKQESYDFSRGSIKTLIIGLSGAAIGYYSCHFYRLLLYWQTALLVAGVIGAFAVMSIAIRLEKYALRFITSFVTRFLL